MSSRTLTPPADPADVVGDAPGSSEPGLGGVAEVRLAVGTAAVLVLTATLHLAHATIPVGLMTHGALVVLVAAVLPLRLALLLAVGSWGFLTGFVVNQAGVLSLGATDLRRLAVLVALGVLGVLAAHCSPLAARRGRRRVP